MTLKRTDQRIRSNWYASIPTFGSVVENMKYVETQGASIVVYCECETNTKRVVKRSRARLYNIKSIKPKMQISFFQCP